MQQKAQSPLGILPIGALLRKFAIPAIISGLVSAVYNITDQIFIGQIVGLNGNAATNVAFPISTLLMALATMLGVGTASNFNLSLGKNKKDDAKNYMGTGLAVSVIFGILLMIIVLLLLDPILRVCGAAGDVMPYAHAYTGITAFGFPFLLFTTANTNLIRADGSPNRAMISTVSGAVLNVGLDALFMLVFGWGITGAAAATVFSQIVSAILTLTYFFKTKSITLRLSDVRVHRNELKGIVTLGTGPFLNQFIMMFVQIIMNNTLTHYGAATEFGTSIPLAVAGVVSKLQMINVTVFVGLSMGAQPIFGFNYGAGNYGRVREAYGKAIKAILCISTCFFLCFQIFPDQLVSIFGSGDNALYFEFARKYMRIFLFMIFIVGIQPITANYFTATGNARRGIFLSLTRQGLFLIPLLLIMPALMGLNGVIYAGPIADGLAVLVSICMVVPEMKRLKKLELGE